MSFEVYGRPEYANKLTWGVVKNRTFSDSIFIGVTLLAPHPTKMESEDEVTKFAAEQLQNLNVAWISADGDNWTIDFDRLRAEIPDSSILPAWAVGRRHTFPTVKPGMIFVANPADGRIFGTGIERVEKEPLSRFYDGIDVEFYLDKGDAFRELGEHLEELQQKVETTKPTTVVANLGSELSFMASEKLRAVVISDLEEIDRGLSVGSAKSTMISCGSALEGILLDILDRRPDIAKSYLKKRQQDWPDRVALKQLVDIALDEGLLTTTTAQLAVAITDHRDLIHPLRCAAANIHVDDTTAESMVHLLKLAVRDLAKAGRDGKIAAYVNKQ